MGRLVLALVVAASLLGPAWAEEKAAAEKKAEAPTGIDSRAPGNPAGAAAKRTGRKAEGGRVGGEPAAHEAGRKPEAAGSVEKPCEPVEPCPIDG